MALPLPSPLGSRYASPSEKGGGLCITRVGTHSNIQPNFGGYSQELQVQTKRHWVCGEHVKTKVDLNSHTFLSKAPQGPLHSKDRSLGNRHQLGDRVYLRKQQREA